MHSYYVALTGEGCGRCGVASLGVEFVLRCVGWFVRSFLLEEAVVEAYLKGLGRRGICTVEIFLWVIGHIFQVFDCGAER